MFESLDLQTIVQIGFSFWVAIYSLTKLKTALDNHTKILTVISTRLGIGADEHVK
jgi:hypothetical protein